MGTIVVWQGVVIVVVTWIASGAMAYGIMKEKASAHEQRISAIEQNQDKFVPRLEYEARHKDQAETLRRIESKIDRNYRSGGI